MGDQRKSVRIFTDGACSGNPGPGGWCAVLLYRVEDGEKQKVLCGGAPDTTNNRMELTALLEGLRALKKPCDVTVLTDSQNIIGWLSSPWSRKNAEIARLLNEIEKVVQLGDHKLEFVKVRAHSGDPINEHCDRIAKSIARNGGKPLAA
ncbi:reverse transcriptase-like protein [bacterium]|nr:reverse transcriptase-like protein [bacterium]